MLRLVVLLSVVLVAWGQTTTVSQCTSHEGELPINTYIEGCTTPPCVFPQLQDAVIEIIFRAPRTTRTMTTLATAYMSVLGLLPITINHDLQENAATCNFLTNSYCPVIAGEVLQYTLKMYIEPQFFVGAAPTVEFRVVDDNSVPFFCVRVPIRISAAINSSSARNGTATLDLS